MAYNVLRKTTKYYKYEYGEPYQTNTGVFKSKEEAISGLDGVKIIQSPEYYVMTSASTVTVNRNPTVVYDLGETSRGIRYIAMNGIGVPDHYPSIRLLNVQCSPDNLAWTNISSAWGDRNTTLSNPLNIGFPNNYRYVRFTIGVDRGSPSQGGVNSFRIGYDKLSVKTVDGTKDDYDFYETKGSQYNCLTKVKRYFVEKLLVDQNVAGTYTFTAPETGTYNIMLVSGGAGGAFNSSDNRSSAAGGGSGSGAILDVTLTGGKEYTVVVGDGGAPSGWRDADTWGGAGGNSLLQAAGVNLITVDGGKGGHVWWPNAGEAGTPSAMPTIVEGNPDITLIEWKLQKRGNQTPNVSGNPSNGGASVISGTNYGRGGNAYKRGGGSYGDKGYVGYGKVVFKKEVTADAPYDYSVDVINKYYTRRKKTKYYKFEDIGEFKQPVLSNNGAWNGSAFAVRASSYNNGNDIWKAFDGNPSTYFQKVQANGSYFDFYYPKELIIKRINYTFYDGGQGYAIRQGKLQGSNDYAKWEDIKTFGYSTTWDFSENTKRYRYHRVFFIQGGSQENIIDIKNCVITARVIDAVESTSEDYDFTITEEI